VTGRAVVGGVKDRVIEEGIGHGLVLVKARFEPPQSLHGGTFHCLHSFPVVWALCLPTF
jgi:hypothetical protein